MNFDEDVFLRDLSESSHIAFQYKDEVIGSFKLTDSSKAIAAVRRCSAEVLRAHPIDPFED